MHISRIGYRLAGIAVAVLGIATHATAAAFTWTGGTTGTLDWNVNGNWNPSTGFPNATDADVTIAVNFTGTTTLRLGTAVTVNTLLIDDTTQNQPVIITANGGSLSLASDGVNAPLLDLQDTSLDVQAPVILLADATINPNGTAAGCKVTGGISGGFSITRGTSANTAILSLGGGANNTYTGETRIDGGAGGSLSLAADNSIPDTSVVSFLSGNATVFALYGYSDTIAGLKNTDGGDGDNIVRNAGASTRPTATLTLNVTAASLTYSGQIANSRSDAILNLVKSGAGTQVLSGSKTYTGYTTVQAGTLDLGAANNSLASTQINLEGGTLDVDGAAYTMASAQTYTWTLNPAGSGSTGVLKAGALTITDAKVDFATLGTLDDPVHVLAEYTAGQLTGTQFATVSNLPAMYSLNYAYQGNQIALVGPPNGTVVFLR